MPDYSSSHLVAELNDCEAILESHPKDLIVEMKRNELLLTILEQIL